MAGRHVVSDTGEFTVVFVRPRPGVSVRLDPANLPHRRGGHAQPPRRTPPHQGQTVDDRRACCRRDAVLKTNSLLHRVFGACPDSRVTCISSATTAERSRMRSTTRCGFWNPDHTRYTVFLDPGRVKRGMPNEQMGRALRAGHAYALVVDTAWHDANGLPLARRIAPSSTPVQPSPSRSRAAWAVRPPRWAHAIRSSRRSHDHSITVLRRAIGVSAKGGASSGRDHHRARRRWRLAAPPWRAGDYQLVVLSILEDVAGNRRTRIRGGHVPARRLTSAPERPIPKIQCGRGRHGPVPARARPVADVEMRHHANACIRPFGDELPCSLMRATTGPARSRREIDHHDSIRPDTVAHHTVNRAASRARSRDLRSAGPYGCRAHRAPRRRECPTGASHRRTACAPSMLS